MSKPAHRGRILVSSSRVQEGSLPVLGNQNQRTHNPHPQPPVSKAMSNRRGSGSKSADVIKKGSLVAAGTSALAGMSKEKLQRHVAELEFENTKLQSNLQKAEISIEGYRGFLSEKSAKRAYSVAIQTDFLSESNSTSKITPNKKNHITKLTNKLEEATNKILQLNQEIAEFTEREKDSSSYKSQYMSLKMNTELAEVSYKAQILTLEKDLRAASDRLQQTTEQQTTAQFQSPTPNFRTPTQTGQKFKAPLSVQGSTPMSSKKQCNVEELSTPTSSASSAAVSSSLPSSLSLKKNSKMPATSPTSSERLGVHPTSSVEILTVLSPLPSMKKLKTLSLTKTHPATTSATSLSMKELRKKMNTHHSQFRTIQNLIRQDLNEYSDFFSQGSVDIIKEIQKFEGNRDTLLKKHTNTIDKLRRDLAEAKTNAANTNSVVVDSTSALEKKFASAIAALEREVSAAKDDLDREKDHSNSLNVMYESKINEKEADLSSLTTLFTSVSRELQNLHAKFKSEAAAVKHMGHCKDLVRVATIRELNLDKDRAFSELKYAR